MSGDPQKRDFEHYELCLKANQIIFVCKHILDYMNSDYMNDERGYINRAFGNRWINPVMGNHVCGKPYSRQDIKTKAWLVYDDSKKRR